MKVKLTDWDGHTQIYTHTAGALIGHNAMVRTLHVCVSIPRARVRSGQWGLGWQRGREGWGGRADEREGWRRKAWGHCGNRGNHSVVQQVGLKMLRRQWWKRSVDMTDETIRGCLLMRSRVAQMMQNLFSHSFTMCKAVSQLWCQQRGDVSGLSGSARPSHSSRPHPPHLCSSATTGTTSH